MRHSLFLCLTSALLCLAPNLCAAGHRDLAGAWTLDVLKSSTYNGRPIQSATLNIEYRHRTAILSESMRFADGSERAVAMEWIVDGRYHPVGPSGSGQIRAKWEGLTLTADHQTNGPHEIIRLSLSPDGQTLTETVSGGASDRVLVWKRQFPGGS
jgi:hypothetical protein